MDHPISVATLQGVPETNLIPLAARAMARTRFPDLAFSDPEAERIAAVLDADLSRFQSDPSVMWGYVVRAAWFDRALVDVLRRYPDALVVSMGCGLDTQFSRVSAKIPEGRFQWINTDFPEVVGIRKQIIPDTPRNWSMVADITTSGWQDQFGLKAGTPIVFICEGVLMYLEASQVRQVFATLAQAFVTSGVTGTFFFDYCSPLMAWAGKYHPSIRKTSLAKRPVSPFVSSLRWAEDIRQFDSRWSVLAETDKPARVDALLVAVSSLHRLFTGGRRLYGVVHAQYKPDAAVR